MRDVQLAKLADELSRLSDPQQDPIHLFDLVKDCTGDDLEWLAKEFERRAWKENEVAFVLRRLRIDRR